MRKFKTSSSIIISIIMLFSTLSMYVISASAADGYKITVKSAQSLFGDVSKVYKAGDTFDLNYYVKAKKKMLDGTVYLKYDKSSLGIASDKGKKDYVVMGEQFPECTSIGNYNTKKDAYVFTYTSPNGSVGDYTSENLLITFRFVVSENITSDKVIDFDINLLGAADTKKDSDGYEVADSNNLVSYISNHTVKPEYASDFSVRVALTGGTDIKPEETVPATAATENSTAEITQATQTTNIPETSAQSDTQPESSENNSAIYGDANGDKSISIKDVTLIQKYIVALTQLSQDVQRLCDVNDDNQLNIKDATCIQWYLVKVNSRAGKTGSYS